MITVLLADDQALVRAGFRLILDETDDIIVVGEAADGLTAVTLAEQLEPNVVLMDIRMPGIDGIEGTRRIRSRRSTHDGPRVIILTTFDLDEYVFSALQAGASGFLFKDALAADLLSAIRVVAAGQSVAAPTVTRRLIEHFVRSAPRTADADAVGTLTSRELDVLRLVARGLSNQEIARTLFVTEGTVKTHVSHLLLKLGLRDRVQAVIYAHQLDLG
jgi:DNA-binding NarL/FixJ family response regulator